MKTTKIIYWTSTTLIVLLEGVIGTLTSNSELAMQGINHLDYPDYFRVMLTIFKIIGAIALILPVIKDRFKEWAYAGFAINFICAVVSHWVVDGFGGETIFPFIAFAVLVVSYLSYHKLSNQADTASYKNNFQVL